MVEILAIGALATFYGVLLASVYKLENFVIKRTDKEISDILKQFKNTVIGNDIKTLRAENQMKKFYSDYRLSILVERDRNDAEKYGLYT